MADTVSIDYASMQKVSQGFSHEAAAVKKIIGDLENHLQQLNQGQGWKADGATKFYNVMGHDVMPRLKRLEHALEHTASRCANEIPKTFKNATDEACQAFPNNS
jgi:WXG100 family type VII secretion target